MNDFGRGIATAGIWIGVGISALSGEIAIIVAICATFATIFV